MSIRLSWLNYYQKETLHPVDNGYIDLTNAVLSEESIIHLRKTGISILKQG